MRPITLAIALTGAVAAAGCGRSSSTGSGSNRGVPTSTMKVTIQNGGGGNAALAIQGGYVTSSPAGIDCGGTGHAACSYDFPYGGGPVELTAHPSPSTNVVLFWAGDCTGLDLTCTLDASYADRYVVVQMGEWGRRQSHPNWSSGAVHSAQYQNFLAGVEGALQCTWCHGANLQGVGLALACDRCHAMPTSDVNKQRPVVSVATSFSGVTGTPATLTVGATDPNPLAGPMSCSAALLSQPAGSNVPPVLGAISDCKVAPQTVSFTPAVDGVYTVRVTATAGAVSSSRDVYLGATPYTGGQVTGVASATSDVTTGVVDRLRQDISSVPAYGTGVAAANVYRTLARISPVAPPTDGSASTQTTPALTWANRPWDIIDVRDSANFAAGHIPGAINVPLQDLPNVLLAQPWFPNATNVGAKPALVVGYTQGDSSLGAIVVTAGRASSGQPAGTVNFLNNGMATWNYDKAQTPFRWSDDLGTFRFEFKLTDSGPGGTYLESGGTWSFTGNPTYGQPTVADFSGDIASTNIGTIPNLKRILVRLREWTKWAAADNAAHGRIPAEAFVTDWGFYKQLRDAGEPHHVLSRQTASEWATARAVGAFRGDDVINSSGVITQANLKYVDPTRETLVHCYTNGSAVRPGFVWAVLGYRARTVMYGIGGLLSWGIVGAGSTGANGANDITNLQDSGSGGNDFALSKVYPDSQDLAWTQPAAAGCRACHADYGALYTIAAKQTSAPTPPVLSEGEG